MNGITNYNTMSYYPRFRAGKKMPPQAAETAVNKLKNLGVTIGLCEHQTNRCCNTLLGIVSLNYKGKTFNHLVSSAFIREGYYSSVTHTRISTKVDEEGIASYLLNEYKKSGKGMVEFLKEGDAYYNKAV